MLVTTQWPLKRAPHLTSLVWVCVLWRCKSSLELVALWCILIATWKIFKDHLGWCAQTTAWRPCQPKFYSIVGKVGWWWQPYRMKVTSDCLHCRNITGLTQFVLLAALEVRTSSTLGSTSDKNFIKMTTSPFRCMEHGKPILPVHRVPGSPSLSKPVSHTQPSISLPVSSVWE